MKIFSERLVELRQEKHLSQKELAKAIGSSSSTVAFWELDQFEPTAPYLVKLADVFGVSVDYLLGRADF